MADYSASSSSAPPANGFQLESDDISNFLHTLLRSSTPPFSSSALDISQHKDQQPPPPQGIRRQFCGSAAFSESSSGVDFSFRCEFYSADEGGRSRNALSGAVPSSAEEIGDFGCEGEKDQNAPGVQRNSGPPRSSSKRTRTAEIHNLSEKRRRQKINERLKALQKLIPYSNKADKASMLDEVIEYLKQLQLRVQVLALRNGSAPHTFYLPGVMHSARPADTGISFNGGGGLRSCSDGGIVSASVYQEMPVQSLFNASSVCAPDREIFVPASLATGNSRRSFAPEPSTSTHCRPCNFVMPSKVDASRCGDGSSSGVSS